MIRSWETRVDADYALVDLGSKRGCSEPRGPHGSDYLVVPMASDLFSIRALPSVGKSLDTWVSQWGTATGVAPPLTFPIPTGRPKLLG